MEHKILTKNGFSDLHIHTNFSHGEEKNLIDISPLKLLSKMAELSEKRPTSRITFSLTDHNNTAGNLKIISEIESDKTGKYKNIDFIPGVEFTVDGEGLGVIKLNNGEERNIFPRFHLLAYGFDPYDKDLSAYSRLMDTTKTLAVVDGVPIISGAMIFLAVKFLRKELGLKVRLSDFDAFKFEKHCKNPDDFISYAASLVTFCKKNCGLNLSGSEQKMISAISNIHSLQKRNKLGVYDVMELVENAGGVSVLAHPGLINPNKKIYASSFNPSIQTDPCLYSFYIDPEKPDQSSQRKVKTKVIDYVLDKLKNHAYATDGKKLRGIVGLELFHSDNIHHLKIDNLGKLAEKYGLYVTGGSDYHGSYHRKAISMIVPFEIDNETPRTENRIKNVTYSLEKCMFADMCIRAKENYNTTLEEFLKEDGKKYTINEQATITHSNYHTSTRLSFEEYCQKISHKPHKNSEVIIKQSPSRKKQNPYVVSQTVQNQDTDFQEKSGVTKSSSQPKIQNMKKYLRAITDLLKINNEYYKIANRKYKDGTYNDEKMFNDYLMLESFRKNIYIGVKKLKPLLLQSMSSQDSSALLKNPEVLAVMQLLRENKTLRIELSDLCPIIKQNEKMLDKYTHGGREFEAEVIPMIDKMEFLEGISLEKEYEKVKDEILEKYSPNSKQFTPASRITKNQNHPEPSFD